MQKKNSFLKIAIVITAVTLLLALTAWFVTADGPFSLFGLFDRLFDEKMTLTA